MRSCNHDIRTEILRRLHSVYNKVTHRNLNNILPFEYVMKPWVIMNAVEIDVDNDIGINEYYNITIERTTYEDRDLH